MKILNILLVLTIILSSCSEIVFENPQPLDSKDLSVIPESLRGKFAFVALNNEEWLEVGATFIENEKGKSFLSDSLILRKFGNRYVLSKKIKSQTETNGKWSIQMIEEKGCGFLKVTGFFVSKEEELPALYEKYGGKEIPGQMGKSVIMAVDKNKFESMASDDLTTVALILERLEE